ncbi:hypothetical protein ACWGTI_20445 [Mesorhizobium sp. ArgA1]
MVAIALVTARHVARQLISRDFCIRANIQDGTSETFWLHGSEVQWWTHATDETVDAAVLLWPPPTGMHFNAIPPVMFLNPEKVASKRISVGDEVYVTGLFSPVPGGQKILPIVRTGNMALMPPSGERIPNPSWHMQGVEGYLIECRSIKGLSGSPVFVQRSIEVEATEVSGRKPLAAGAIFWLGLIHGHFDAPVEIASDNPEVESKSDIVNTGIAIVTPSAKVIEIFQRREFQDNINSAAEYVESHGGHVIMDGSSPNMLKPGTENLAARLITARAARWDSSTDDDPAWIGSE